LDISLTEGYNLAGRHPVARNDLAANSQTQSLQITVVDKNGIANRAGSEVRVYDITDNLLGLRLVTTGDGYNSHSNQPVHFGLADIHEVIVEVTFMTPGGRKTQRVEKVSPAAFVGQVLRITQL